MKDLYRLYIDEVGNHSLKPDISENERFLSLFGVLVNGEHMLSVIQPDMRRIKQEYFQQDPDDPIIFHRKDITRFRGPFACLYGDKEKRERFGNEMLDMYSKWGYIAFVVTLDKLAHYNTYSVWRYEPYHYCLATMLERYVLYLHYRNLRGDVMIEARGTKPDQRLAKSYRRLVDNGSENISSSRMQACLTSKEIKIRPKSANIEGLQLADMLAHSAHYDHLVDHKHVDRQKSEYSQKVVAILKRDKYNRNSQTTKIRGYGKKMLP